MGKELERYIASTPRQIVSAAYINSIVHLVIACRKYDVKIDKIFTFQNGWRVTFKGFKGDAIEWDRSGSWETMGFPWDGDDVSVHDTEWLAQALRWLEDGNEYDECWEG